MMTVDMRLLFLSIGEILLGICIILLERKKQNKNK